MTGNQAKADYTSKLLGVPLKHHKVNLDEIQSLDLKVIGEHKVRQAYALLKTPVLIDDVALTFHAMGRLPGTFVKWFIEEIGLSGMCQMLDVFDDRRAIAACVMGYFDGKQLKVFYKELAGTIAGQPRGSGGFGWDRIFIPDGYHQTRAEMNIEDDRATYVSIKPLDELRTFLTAQKTV
ncbi:MAG TPA: non-canonical purine NTP pyrophosphatase [Candidatus Saccharimonadales bacterium]|nr:non-canonical purine NTP pyrophosphatase [Candidatus Saccharimonadales bacterium]